MGEKPPEATAEERDEQARPKRQYPPFYEKVVPIALVVIVNCHKVYIDGIGSMLMLLVAPMFICGILWAVLVY
jgi:hypothetical protein